MTSMMPEVTNFSVHESINQSNEIESDMALKYPAFAQQREKLLKREVIVPQLKLEQTTNSFQMAARRAAEQKEEQE